MMTTGSATIQHRKNIFVRTPMRANDAAPRAPTPQARRGSRGSSSCDINKPLPPRPLRISGNELGRSAPASSNHGVIRVGLDVAGSSLSLNSDILYLSTGSFYSPGDTASDKITIFTPFSTAASACLELGPQTSSVYNLQTGNHIMERTRSTESANLSKLGNTNELINLKIKKPDALVSPTTQVTTKQHKAPWKFPSVIRAVTARNDDPPSPKYRNFSFQFKKARSDSFRTERSPSKAIGHISRQKKKVTERKSKRESARHHQAQVSFFEDEETENTIIRLKRFLLKRLSFLRTFKLCFHDSDLKN